MEQGKVPYGRLIFEQIQKAKDTSYQVHLIYIHCPPHSRTKKGLSNEF